MPFEDAILPQYFFDIKDGRRIVDPKGIDLQDISAATEYARQLAKQLALDDGHKLGRRVVAIDEEGVEVASIPVLGIPPDVTDCNSS